MVRMESLEVAGVVLVAPCLALGLGSGGGVEALAVVVVLVYSD